MELEPKEPMSLTKKERKRIQSLNKKEYQKDKLQMTLKSIGRQQINGVQEMAKITSKEKGNQSLIKR